MNKWITEELFAEGLLPGKAYEKITLKEREKTISVHWELRTFLYLGVLSLSAGLGILVYKNVDTIGHQFILLFIALIFSGCFFYCFRNKLPFSNGKVIAPNAYFDYILLLGCCTFISFIAYLQFQYGFFGNRYGLAIFFPMVLLFFCAYYFDHLGILSMAIVNLAAWLGITVTPMRILVANDFNNITLIITGLALGGLLILMAWLTNTKNIKKHFEFTYANFGTHILLIATLAAMFYFNSWYIPWFLLLMGMVYFFYKRALRNKSFYFILVITLYAYIGICYIVLSLLSHMISQDLAPIFSGFLYFIISAVGIALFLIRTNKKMKSL